MNHWKLGSQRLYWTGGLADFKREGTRSPCLQHGHSASSLHTGNITLTWYMWEFISSQRQPARWSHAMHRPALRRSGVTFTRREKKVFSDISTINDVNIIVARSIITDVAAVVIEVWHKPSSGDWRTAVFTSRQICVAQAIRYSHISPFTWNVATLQWHSVGKARYTLH